MTPAFSAPYTRAREHLGLGTHSARPGARMAYRALALWRREVRAGLRGQLAESPGTWRHDALWEAACWEQAAAEALAAGAVERARSHVRRARTVLEEAWAEG